MFSDLTFRMSTKEDKELLNDLVSSKFGDRTRYRVLDNLEGRYFIAINSDNVIVAMTGLNFSNEYNGPEIDWTCVDDSYTNKGLITYMISKVISNYNGDIYCSCWRNKNSVINLHNAMYKNGFVPAIVPRITYTTEHNCCSNICVKYNPINGICTCCEDLYIRPAR